jgi:hypothetical protein
VAVALVAALSTVLGVLPAAPALASSTAFTGLSTDSSTGAAVVTAAGRPAATVASPATASATGTGGGTAVSTPDTPAQIVLDNFSGFASNQVPLAIQGHVTSTSGAPVSDLTITVSVKRGGVNSRSDLATARQSPKSVAYSYQVPGTTSQTSSFTINDVLSFDTSLTVYPMKITARGRLDGGPARELASLYTFLVWSPAQTRVSPTEVVTVVPIADQPRLRSDGLLTDDGLAREIAQGDRLNTVVAAAITAHTALALDPVLLRELDLMARPAGYDFASPQGKLHVKQDTNADAILRKLRAFAKTPGDTVFALPYGDVDLSALLGAGRGTDARYAMSTGQSWVASVLGISATSLAPVAYPPDGLADETTLDFLAGANIRTAILSDQVLPSKSSITPTALTAQQNPAIRALAADSVLDKLVATDAPGKQGQQSVDQGLSDVRAELAAITNEQPGAKASRLAVVALPRNWNPSADWANGVLNLLGVGGDIGGYTQPFTPVSLSLLTYAVGAPPPSADPALNQTAGYARSPVTYPASAAAQEIPTAYVDAVELLRDEAGQLDSVLCSTVVDAAAGTTANPGGHCALTDKEKTADPKLPDGRRDVVGGMKDTLLTALSVWWRTNRAGAVALSQEVDGRIQDIRKSIAIVASAKVTLTSRTGRVPLNVQNIRAPDTSNAFPMTVILSLSSNDRTRLKSASRQVLTVRPNEHPQIEISVSSDAAGTFPLYIQVLTPDGERLSTTTARILVRSTAYGAIATAITYATIGLFAAAVVLRQIRRFRRRRRGDGGGRGGDGPDSPGTGPAGAVKDVTPPGTNAVGGTDRATEPVRRIQANAAGAQRIEVERAYAGGVPVNPSER